MSQTDLELCQDLPKIRVQLSPMIKQIQTPEPAEAKPADSAATPAANRISAIQRRNNDDGVKEEEEEEECRTPTSEEHRIPVALTCPPAPRKPARASACKRKLSPEFEYFEAVNRDEVEEYFRSSFVVKAAKRNCCPCK